MMMGGSEESPGAQLLDLCAGAEHGVLLAAPFVKAPSLRRLLSRASPGVDVTCVTRWRPEEVAVGVSDLEVLEEIERREQGTLLLSPRLHAKYFRADDRCLVGSANLTGRALGWVTPSNVELLIDAPAANPSLLRFERSLLASAHEATPELRAVVQAAAEQIRADASPFVSLPVLSEAAGTSAPENAEESLPEPRDFRAWIPSLRQPEALYIAYQGSLDQLTTASRQAAASDLTMLDPPPRLSRSAFEAVIGVALLQMPLIALIDEFVLEPRRFGAVRDLIATRKATSSRAAGSMWQTTMRWLLHFLPGRYVRSVPSHSEVFGRVSSSWPL